LRRGLLASYGLCQATDSRRNEKTYSYFYRFELYKKHRVDIEKLYVYPYEREVILIDWGKPMFTLTEGNSFAMPFDPFLDDLLIFYVQCQYTYLLSSVFKQYNT